MSPVIPPTLFSMIFSNLFVNFFDIENIDLEMLKTILLIMYVVLKKKKMEYSQIFKTMS